MKANHYKRPQVLLLGNGIIRAYSSLAMSWKEMLRRIGTDDSIPDDLNIPMPLEIVLRTGDHVDVVLKDHYRELYGCVETAEFRDILTELLSMGFDHVLTTNYSYEMEEAAAGRRLLDDEEIDAMRRCTPAAECPEENFMLYTYNYTECGENRNRIWHIHGEAEHPDTIVLGHLYYGNLLSKCRDYLVSRGGMDMKPDPEKPADSWVDAFITGDVYTLGFGYDFSEMDLWWLLDCKKNICARTNGGKLYYYRPEKPKPFDVKAALLRDYGAEVINFGEREPGKNVTEYYRGFYKRSIEDIRQRMAEIPLTIR